MNVFLYPAVHISPDELVSNFTMVSFGLTKDNCDEFYQHRDMCTARVECNWCEGSRECLPFMEVHRPENVCFDHLQEPGERKQSYFNRSYKEQLL